MNVKATLARAAGAVRAQAAAWRAQAEADRLLDQADQLEMQGVPPGEVARVLEDNYQRALAELAGATEPDADPGPGAHDHPDYYRAAHGGYQPDWIPEPDGALPAAWDRYMASEPGSDEHKAAYIDMHREMEGKDFPGPDSELSYLADHGYQTDQALPPEYHSPYHFSPEPPPPEPPAPDYYRSAPGSTEHREAYRQMHAEADGQGFADPDADVSYEIDNAQELAWERYEARAEEQHYRELREIRRDEVRAAYAKYRTARDAWTSAEPGESELLRLQTCEAVRALRDAQRAYTEADADATPVGLPDGPEPLDDWDQEAGEPGVEAPGEEPGPDAAEWAAALADGDPGAPGDERDPQWWPPFEPDGEPEREQAGPEAG